MGHTDSADLDDYIFDGVEYHVREQKKNAK